VLAVHDVPGENIGTVHRALPSPVMTPDRA